MPNRQNNSDALPPGPTEKIDLQINEASFQHIQSLVQTYPDICRVSARHRKSDSYILNEPKFIKHVLIDNYKNYTKGIGFERAKLLLGNGIIVSDGELWRQRRHMVQSAFRRDQLKTLTQTIQSVSQALLSRWRELAQRGEAIDLTVAMSEFALEVMLRSLFGDDFDTLVAESGGNPFSIFTLAHERDMNLALKFRALTHLLQSVFERRRQRAIEYPDMLGALMAARDAQGEPLNDKALLDEVMTLIVAGHETSAITLSWMWYFLSQHPDVQSRLLAEIDALGDKASPDYDDLSRLTFCKQVMHEALRLYPPVWLFSRRARADDRLGEYRIPAGSDIFISPFFLHRRETLWPDAERFDPDRFAEPSAEKSHRATYLPFSAGPRKCIGDVFATQEVQIHMGTIARHIVLRHEPGEPLEFDYGLNLRCKSRIKMIPQVRNPS
ncbi:MAG TPA: cytochrome P450 [Anaerolineae bacterium]